MNGVEFAMMFQCQNVYIIWHIGPFIFSVLWTIGIVYFLKPSLPLQQYFTHLLSDETLLAFVDKANFFINVFEQFASHCRLKCFRCHELNTSVTGLYCVALIDGWCDMHQKWAIYCMDISGYRPIIALQYVFLSVFVEDKTQVFVLFNCIELIK